MATQQKKAQTEKVRKTVGVDSKEFPKVRKANLWLGLVLAVQAIVIAVLGNSFSVALTRPYPAVDPLASEAAGHEVIATAYRTVIDIRIAWLVAVVLLLLAIMHIVQATLYRKHYEDQLSQGQNISRWLGFGITSGVAFGLIALLSGLNQVVSLVAILFLSVIGGALMVAADQLSVGKKNVISHFVCGAATLSLVAPLLFIGTTVLSAVWYDGKISGAMWGIYASVLVLWAALALLTGLRLRRKGQWADMARTERAYMLLAFITISVLAWQVFVGFLYP